MLYFSPECGPFIRTKSEYNGACIATTRGSRDRRDQIIGNFGPSSRILKHYARLDCCDVELKEYEGSCGYGTIL